MIDAGEFLDFFFFFLRNFGMNLDYSSPNALTNTDGTLNRYEHFC